MKKSFLITSILLLGLFISSSYAVEVTLLGPQKYLQTKGKPSAYADNFPGRTGVGILKVMNGDANGKNRISSAVILINGVEILGPNDFNQNVYNLEVPVNLEENNTISVELRSKPGSYLWVQVNQEIEVDGAGVIGPEGGVVEIQDPENPLFGIMAEIPPSSLSDPELITISLSSFASILSEVMPPDTEPAGIPVEFGPDGMSFSSPVLLTLKYFDEDYDGLIDGTSVAEDDAQVIRIIDQGQHENIPIMNLDSFNNTVTISIDHFSSYVVTCFSDIIEYKWDMDSSYEPDWKPDEGSQPYPPPENQYQFGASLPDEYSGLEIFTRKLSVDRIKLRTKSSELFREGTYIWRVFVPDLEPGGCGSIGAFIIRHDGTELDFEIGYGRKTERDFWHANAYQYLCYLTNQTNQGGHIAVPIYGGWHELKMKINKPSGGISKVYWYIDGKLKKIESIVSSDMKWFIFCSAEILPGFTGEDYPRQDFYAYFDYVKYQKPIEENGENLVPNPSFEEGSGQWPDGWEPWRNDYPPINNCIWDSTRSHSGTHSIKFLTSTSINFDRMRTIGFIDVDLTKPLVYSYWALWEGGTARDYIILDLYDENGIRLGWMASPKYPAIPGVWTKNGGTILLPNRTTMIKVLIARYECPYELWIDDVSVVQ